MKIGKNDQAAELAAAALRTQEGQKSKTSEAASGTKAGAGDSASVKLSSTASMLSSENSQGVFDAERVARVQKAIAEGNYPITPEVIADKLIANARELLGPSSQN